MRKCLTTAPEQKNKLKQGWRTPILNGGGTRIFFFNSTGYSTKKSPFLPQLEKFYYFICEKYQQIWKKKSFKVSSHELEHECIHFIQSCFVLYCQFHELFTLFTTFFQWGLTKSLFQGTSPLVLENLLHSLKNT